MAVFPANIPDSLLRIVHASSIGAATFKRLQQHFSTCDAIAGATISQLRDVDGLGSVRADAIRSSLDDVDVAACRDAMHEADVGLIALGDADYPPLLSMIDDPPIALFVQGSITPEDTISIAIVGSRRCTAYGREQAARFAGLLAQSGLTIVSGGARGIDGEAHRAAMRHGGRTIVIMGSGHSNPYPAEHAELFAHIAAEQHGAVLSEYPPLAGPRREHFPRRNRIISGMSLGVLVVEAARGSGALITARAAAEHHGREVMAIPGRVDAPASRGCLQAMRDGWASMVLDHADVLTQLETSAQHLLRGAHASQSLPAAQPAPDEQDDTSASEYSLLAQMNLTTTQESIVNQLKIAGDRILIDDLPAMTQLPMQTIMADLTILQIRGVIARQDAHIRLGKKR